MKKTIIILSVLFVALASIVIAGPVKFEDTGSKEGEIKCVLITENETLPVILKKKNSYVIVVEFVSLEDINDAEICSTFIIKGVKVPIIKGKIEGVTFPLKKNKYYVGMFELPISETFPEVSGFLQIWFMNKDNGNDIFSFKVEAKIINAESK